MIAHSLSPPSLPKSAFGEVELTDDCSDITSARFLNRVGKKTPILVRISTVGQEAGSADTARDVHGWAMKFYTEQGNLDWVFNSTVSHTNRFLKKKKELLKTVCDNFIACLLYQGPY